MKAIYAAIAALGILCSCQKESVVPGVMNGEEKTGVAKGGPGLPNVMPIHILAGQSNARGQGSITGLPSFYLNPNNSSIYNNVSGLIEPLVAGTNNEGGGCGGSFTPTSHGIELSFMRQMCKYQGASLMVKHAVNSSTLYNTIPGHPDPWVAPDNIGACNPQRSWNIHNATSLYPELLAECLAAKAAVIAQGKTPEFRTLVWYQGENNAQHLQRAQAWEADMRELFHALRRDLSSPNMKLIIMKITGQVVSMTYLGVVRQGQDNIGAETWAETINVDSYYIPGNVHLPSNGLIAGGTAAANARIAMP